MRIFSFLAVMAVLLIPFGAGADTKLRVGLAVPLSGMAAEYGVAYKKGIELALADNPADAQKIDLVYEDHRYDTKSAVSAAQKLLSVDKVNLFVAWGWAPSDGIAPLSKDFETPLLLSSINPIGKGRPLVFNLASPLSHLLEPLTKKIIAEKISDIAFLSTPVGALEQSVGEIKSALPGDMVVAETSSYPPDALDFKTVIAKLKAKSVKTVVLFLLPAQIKAFLEQAYAQRYFPRLLGGNTFNDALVKSALRPEQGVPIFVDWVTAPEFDVRLQKAGVPDSHRVEAAQGYFLGSLLLALAKYTAPYPPAAIADYLNHLPPGESPAGPYAAVTSDFGWHILFPAALYEDHPSL